MTSEELLRLKALAARYVVAGAAVGVWWDAVDAHTALEEKEKLLTAAYTGRTLAGIGTISSTLYGARFAASAPMWLTRFNIGLAVATAALSYAIGQLKGDAWANWLKAQPFRAMQVLVSDSDVKVALQLAHLQSKGPAMEATRSRRRQGASRCTGDAAEKVLEAKRRECGRAQAEKDAGQEAAEKTRALCGNAALEAFDKLHKVQLKKRDDLMNLIASDLLLWLRADALIERALGRYNENADLAKSPDGLYCAGQLCAILMQVDSSPKGRAWYASQEKMCHTES